LRTGGLYSWLETATATNKLYLKLVDKYAKM
jgi:hypothetical protein